VGVDLVVQSGQLMHLVRTRALPPLCGVGRHGDQPFRFSTGLGEQLLHFAAGRFARLFRDRGGCVEQFSGFRVMK
jgi:hypothetical protein